MTVPSPTTPGLQTQSSSNRMSSSFSHENGIVPLRQRQLPASFWQEPNVPRAPHPFSPLDFPMMPCFPPPSSSSQHQPMLSWFSGITPYSPSMGSAPYRLPPYNTICMCPHCVAEKQLPVPPHQWIPHDVDAEWSGNHVNKGLPYSLDPYGGQTASTFSVGIPGMESHVATEPLSWKPSLNGPYEYYPYSYNSGYK